MIQDDPQPIVQTETNERALDDWAVGQVTPAPAHPEGDGLAAQTLARLLKLEEVVRNLVPAQSRRTKAIEERVESLQEALMTQVAGIETHYRTAISTAELKLAAQINALKSRVDAAEEGRLAAERRAMEAESEADHLRVHLDAYRQVWQSAPLTLRLKFIRDLMPEEHPLQGMLKEAAALEDLRRRGRDLETWLTNYPSLFADAMQSLEAGQGAEEITAAHGRKPEAGEILAVQTLDEAKSTLGGTLQALGITWIAPGPGDMLQSEHEVIGEEVSQQPEGRIASLRRRGFRVQGRVAMPAQVTRAVAAGAQVATAEHVTAGVDSVASGVAGGAGRQIAPDSEGGELSRAGVPDRTNPSDPSDINAPANATGRAPQPPSGIGQAPPSGGEVQSTQAAPAAGAGAPANTADAPQASASTVRPLQDQQQKPEPQASQAAPARSEAAVPPPTAVQPVTPLTITGEMPDWLRMLIQRTHGCDSQPVLRFVYQIVKLVNLPAQLGRERTAETIAAALTETLLPLLPLLGMRYADALPEVDTQWGAVLLEVRDPLISWLREKPQVTVLAPVRGQKFDPQTMEAIETRRTVHESENETVSRVDGIGLIWRDLPLVRARVVRYATEGAR